MSYLPKTKDWRSQPVEVRQALLEALQKQAPLTEGKYLTRAELADACGIVPDSEQRDLLESDAQQIMLNCCRQ